MRHQLDRGRWQRLLRGLIATHAEPPAREDWILAGVELAGPRAALSGWDAARMHGLGGRQPPRAAVLILDRSGRHHTSPLLRVRATTRPFRSEALPAEHGRLAFVEVVEPARAVADTALQLTSRRATRALVTSTIQRRRCTPAELEFELRTGPRQHEAGTTVAEADVLWRELRAVLEIDGREYHLSEDDWQHSLERNAGLVRHALSLQQVSPRQIREGRHAWADGIADWLRHRAWELGRPYRAGGGPVAPGPDGPAPYHLHRDC